MIQSACSFMFLAFLMVGTGGAVASLVTDDVFVDKVTTVNLVMTDADILKNEVLDTANPGHRLGNVAMLTSLSAIRINSHGLEVGAIRSDIGTVSI